MQATKNGNDVQVTMTAAEALALMSYFTRSSGFRKNNEIKASADMLGAIAEATGAPVKW